MNKRILITTVSVFTSIVLILSSFFICAYGIGLEKPIDVRYTEKEKTPKDITPTVTEDFFTEEDTHERFHEICIYFLVDGSSLPAGSFIYTEGERTNRFEWTPVPAVLDMHLYPEFIRKRIAALPAHPEWITERQ